MSVVGNFFGKIEQRKVEEYVISRGNKTIGILTYGAIIRFLKLIHQKAFTTWF